MIPPPIQAWLQENRYGPVLRVQAVGGGCINAGARLQTESGKSFFLKTNSQTPPDMFAREAEGLLELAVPEGPVVPWPWLYGPNFLLMEDLAPAARRAEYWSSFGRQMAALHTVTRPHFGFQHDNYIGSTPQPNSWTEDGYLFFARQRLLFQADLAHRRGLLGRNERGRVERLAERLSDWIPLQPASLLHGDLWTGNAICNAQGQPAIIDPAVHYGWAEAELAMTTLFGSFPAAFYQAYAEVRPLQAGYRQRFPLYNLYHLLNHVNLFGAGYVSQVQSILRLYD